MGVGRTVFVHLIYLVQNRYTSTDHLATSISLSSYPPESTKIQHVGRIPLDELINTLDAAVTPTTTPTPAIEPAKTTRVQPTRTAKEKNVEVGDSDVKIVSVRVRCAVVMDFIDLAGDSDDYGAPCAKKNKTRIKSRRKV